MRSALIFLCLGAFAGSLSAQRASHSGPLYAPTVRPLLGRSGIGSPQLPPGLNGLRGIQQTPGLNGIPSFSNGIYNYGCFGCNPVRGRQSNLLYGFGYPLFSSYAYPSYPGEEVLPTPGLLPPVDPDTLSIAGEVDRLRGEVYQLKMRSAMANGTMPPLPPAAPPAPEVNNQPPEPATLIVLRDGQRIETTNYAVMDQTLWNFSARPVQKVPLSSIDMTASEKANSERGVDFSLSANATN